MRCAINSDHFADLSGLALCLRNTPRTPGTFVLYPTIVWLRTAPGADASWDAGFGKGESNHRAKAARSTTSASQFVRERGLETVCGVFFRTNRRDEESWSTLNEPPRGRFRASQSLMWQFCYRAGWNIYHLSVRTCFGVSARRALGTSGCAQSIRPKRATSRAKLLSACRVSRQRDREHSREVRVCIMRYRAPGEGNEQSFRRIALVRERAGRLFHRYSHLMSRKNNKKKSGKKKSSKRTKRSARQASRGVLHAGPPAL